MSWTILVISVRLSLLILACAASADFRCLSCPRPEKGLILGGSPFRLCEASLVDTQVVVVQRLIVTPTHPSSGDTVSFCLSAFFKEDVSCGATVDVMVLLDHTRIVKKTYDLCALASKTTLTCPIKAGERFLLTQVDLPYCIPAGRYTMTAQFFTPDERPLTCITGEVTMN
ncbi:ML domain-domain-containing protein [Protomyces lactucae-debilis]|uniref:Phosphatidylglycerol/phosphatidylinositol transfer protein n=1 Tax=Protomyces lactucae-debilis TaxID=2754530 RepID=A0A1Y2FLC2_PROLT|nr:ML domain-containing protein [Protomyces lactucae-debilis]ORY84801.1 ML domain-domain-containing protein [Protomyces lactucae-debilis]